MSQLSFYVAENSDCQIEKDSYKMSGDENSVNCPNCNTGKLLFFGERASYIETGIAGFFGAILSKSILPRVVVYECNRCGFRKKISKV